MKFVYPHPRTGFEWTNDPSKDQTREDNTDPDSTYYVWIDSMVVHEFGHTFGVADYYGKTGAPYDTYRGVMKSFLPGEKFLRDDDKAAIRAIYKTHIKNVGW